MSGFTADRESPPVRGNLSSTEPGIPTYQSAGTNTTRLVHRCATKGIRRAALYQVHTQERGAPRGASTATARKAFVVTIGELTLSAFSSFCSSMARTTPRLKGAFAAGRWYSDRWLLERGTRDKMRRRHLRAPHNSASSQVEFPRNGRHRIDSRMLRNGPCTCHVRCFVGPSR
jgi:hypothetical protein